MRPNALNPKGLEALRVNDLWWVLFGMATFVVVLVIGLLLYAFIRGHRRNESPEELRQRSVSKRDVSIVLSAGVVMPAIVLVTLFIVTLEALADSNTDLSKTTTTVSVVGHQFWWEVRYTTPTGEVTTANEIHIPTNTKVRLELTSADVNHSFWVPQLAPKTDLIPGQTNTMWLDARSPGSYHGQCAEFCGVQHANMAFTVIAQPPAEYQQWLSQNQKPAAAPSSLLAATGESTFMTSACVSCHTIQGTQADGKVGPDLTHIASRKTIGAGVAPNDASHLKKWIMNAQTLKPGSNMPPMSLTDSQADSIVAYLETLK